MPVFVAAPRSSDLAGQVAKELVTKCDDRAIGGWAWAPRVPEHPGAGCKRWRGAAVRVPRVWFCGRLEGGGLMRRYLVVANQTLQAEELLEELRKRIRSGPCSFFVIVPDTKAAQYDPWQPALYSPAEHVVVGDLLRSPDHRRGGGSAGPGAPELDAGRARSDGCLRCGRSGERQPARGHREGVADHQFDEIIVATLPRHVSSWLRADLPHQVERRFRLPVTTIITSY